MSNRQRNCLLPSPLRYWLWKPFLRQTAVTFDMRKQSIWIAGQEILTRDHVPIRLTLAATYQFRQGCFPLANTSNRLH